MRIIERVSLETWSPPWLRFQHLARYAWAASLARDCRVIDTACGTGYGSRMLAEAGAASVTGFDLDEATIAIAQRTLASEQLTFACADAAQLPVADQSIDLYTSFETIEHVVDDEALVREAARVLRPGGRFLCSTPNRLVTNPRTTIRDQPFNRFHVREYTQTELHALLQRHFTEIHWRGQTFFTRRWQQFLEQAARLNRRLSFRCHQLRKLTCLPWERREWHLPRPFVEDRHPEYLVAECIR